VLTGGPLFEVLSSLSQIAKNGCIKLDYSPFQLCSSFGCIIDIQSFHYSVATDQLSYLSKAFYHQREFVGIVDSDLQTLQLLSP
jgi:hypothetical protein